MSDEDTRKVMSMEMVYWQQCCEEEGQTQLNLTRSEQEQKQILTS